MYKTDTPAAPKPRPARADCCPESECTSGLRNNYYVGKRLTPDSFTVEQRYLNGRRHLLNRTLFGAGVVKGYAVAYAQDKVRDQPPGVLLVSTGLALDEAGHELLNTETLALRVEDVIVLDENGQPRARCKGKAPAIERGTWWKLCVHYAERPLGRTTVRDDCSCERHPWDRVCETVRFTLAPVKGLQACCEEPACGFECRCPEGECCGRTATREPVGPVRPGGVVMEPKRPVVEEKVDVARQAQAGLADRFPGVDRPGIPVPVQEAPAMRPVPRGGCECLCLAIAKPLDDADAVCLTHVDEACGPVCVDLRHCVALACVQLVADDCGNPAFSEAVEPCGPRPLVLNNRLLFDLIRGCDLTRPMHVGWERFHRRTLEWADFKASFGDFSPGKGWSGGVYSLGFTKSVVASTLRPECFAMTVMVRDESTGWWRMLRAPIVDLDLDLEPGNSLFARGARLVFDEGWWDDEIDDDTRIFNDETTLVELEIRGDEIIDCNDLAVDADVNGAPGGRWITSFWVKRPPEPPPRQKRFATPGTQADPSSEGAPS